MRLGYPRHPAAQTCHEEPEQRQPERLDGGLEVQQKENPGCERHKQAAEKPPEIPVVGDDQKPDLTLDTGDKTDSEQHVAERHHLRPFL